MSSSISRVWSKTLGSASTFTVGDSIASFSDGSIYISGSSRGSLDGQLVNGLSDAFITKCRSDGTEE